LSRIIAGTARGRRLVAPRGLETRPTSDKVRGAVMNLLGQFFDGGEVLDLYAGTGALALEALSRGCTRAVCVDTAAQAARAIQRNAEACGLADRVEVRRGRVEEVLPGLPPRRFALAFVDPPYREGPDAALAAMGGALVSGARVVAEHDARRPPPDRIGALTLSDRRSYGDTGISIYVRD
jgi:16S rRNA (guanine966-N2)-methyltransferase